MALIGAVSLEYAAVSLTADDGGDKAVLELFGADQVVNALLSESTFTDCAAAPALGVYPEPAPGHPSRGADSLPAAGGSVVCGPHGHHRTRGGVRW